MIFPIFPNLQKCLFAARNPAFLGGFARLNSTLFPKCVRPARFQDPPSDADIKFFQSPPVAGSCRPPSRSAGGAP
ncbi:hypothetical protein, partial [Burkholderia ambifaria]|uniref:hypothetical protein n=1 Tax=Burkholderia ambifaria TaxID=152480 RepID=UPI001E63B7AF